MEAKTCWEGVLGSLEKSLYLLPLHDGHRSSQLGRYVWEGEVCGRCLIRPLLSF